MDETKVGSLAGDYARLEAALIARALGEADAAGKLDVPLALDLLARRDLRWGEPASGAPRASRSATEVALLARLDAHGRGPGVAKRGAAARRAGRRAEPTT